MKQTDEMATATLAEALGDTSRKTLASDIVRAPAYALHKWRRCGKRYNFDRNQSGMENHNVITHFHDLADKVICTL
jgi:hypothetical protein